ncbi:hypothetical protein glysoja_027794 [Glycine soja]|uniref:Uncharacterized protein n=1 Tax=Glycine soja TaxID=3848 RepID=A0A0B2QIE8_GLYSO|nr:hypothetical protein glysoja_027794 [Glycine soja]
MLFTLSLPLLNSAFDLITVIFISGLIILSVLSLCFIFHLRFKSKSITHLQGFNSLWTVRFLLVLFIFLWSITELLRLPFFRRKYLYPFVPSFSISQQANLCKVHIVLSLGFFEPAFLVTLLFLLNASIKRKTPNNDKWAITSVLLTCLPVATLQALLIFFAPFKNRVPAESSVVLNDGYGFETVLCAYPFLSSVLFAVFGVAYSSWFLFSCWRVLLLVINKGLRGSAFCGARTRRFTELFRSWGSSPRSAATAGEGILVIKPISDALDAGGNCCVSTPQPGARQSEETEESGVVVRLEGG